MWALVGFRVYSRTSRAGGGGSQETAVRASFLSTAAFSCTNIEHTDDAAKALILSENDEVHLFEYLRSRAKNAAIVGTRRSGATGQAEDLP